MIRIVFSFMISLCIFLSGCSRVCENVKVGEAFYSDVAQAFFTYNDGDKITFASQDGREIEFTVNVEEEKFFICQKITCNPIDPYKSSSCEYIEAPQNSVFLISDSTLIGLTASIQSYEAETDLLYEYVKFSISHNNDSAEASYITDVRFTSPTFDQSTISDIEEFAVERSIATLNDQEFEDVLLCADEKLSLFYQKYQGFIGFTLEGITYSLK